MHDKICVEFKSQDDASVCNDNYNANYKLFQMCVWMCLIKSF